MTNAIHTSGRQVPYFVIRKEPGQRRYGLDIPRVQFHQLRAKLGEIKFSAVSNASSYLQHHRALRHKIKLASGRPLDKNERVFELVRVPN